VLWTITVILLILWLLGMISGYVMSGFIHILLVIAIRPSPEDFLLVHLTGDW
jgi:hypothetical protein